jgi:hypothetical protein
MTDSSIRKGVELPADVETEVQAAHRRFHRYQLKSKFRGFENLAALFEKLTNPVMDLATPRSR